MFPAITKEKIPGILNFSDNFLDIEYQGRDFHVTMKKISLREMAENSDIIEGDDYEGFLVALYMFDQTALKIALKENIENKNVIIIEDIVDSGLTLNYLYNYLSKKNP